MNFFIFCVKVLLVHVEFRGADINPVSNANYSHLFNSTVFTYFRYYIYTLYIHQTLLYSQTQHTVANFDKKSPPSALEPIAHLFICFEEEGRKTWAIKKSHFYKWQRTGKAPKVSSGRPPKWKGNPNTLNINIPFPKNLYDEFKRVVDKANSLSRVHVTYRDMIAGAVQEFVDRRPNLK